MLSIAKHQSKHSDSTSIFQKTQHILLCFFFFIVHQCLSFSLCSLTKCPYSALFPRLCLRWLSSQRLLAVSSAALCSYFTSNRLHYSRSLNSQVGLCPACSHLYPLSSPILTLSSPVPRNGY